MVAAICKELEMRKDESIGLVETIYFGGGTPSLLNLFELEQLFDAIYSNYSIVDNPEITLEANPDDLTIKKVKELKSTYINRFSIGVQSFFDEDLKLMNRAHNATEALHSIKSVQNAGFENISIDLIYGAQTTTDQMWQKNLQFALELEIPHISSYALTVEPKTLLAHEIKTKKIKDIDEEKQEKQYKILVETLTGSGFVHYEISNFGKIGFLSQHNQSYWQGKPYLGVGPSAHSYNGETRSWNIANNALYLKEIENGNTPNEIEVLSELNRFNELIMIELRTINGIDLDKIRMNFPTSFLSDLLKSSEQFFEQNMLEIKDNKLLLTENGKFLADGISAYLFRV